ncbi:MAG: hypothetical protein GX241_01710 [Ruminococcaceae bacterium]|nr:hypothetical protein [Oscillospiraceae bacterium]
MKKIISIILCFVFLLSFAACGADKKAPITIAVPNDTTNEARALILLENMGLIKLKEGAGITATKADIVENPYGIEIKEVEAAQLPNVLQDVDYAVINSNYAIEAGLSPKNALDVEGAFSNYANIICVKEGNEKADWAKALIAAVSSQKVADYIEEKYNGEILGVVENPTDGFDKSVDYAALKGKKITVAASPTPHAEILAVAKEILAEKEIILEIKEFTDYVQPNNVVDSGEVDANYFQHLPYLEDFNKENGTKVVSIAAIHVEPMGIYGGKQTSLDAIKAK